MPAPAPPTAGPTWTVRRGLLPVAAATASVRVHLRVHLRFGLLLGLLGALLAGVLAAVPASATAGDATWSVRPEDGAQGADRPNFAYQLDAGSVVEDALLVTNRGTDTLDLHVYAADAFVTSSGQYDLLTAGAPSTDLGTWVRVGLDTLSLAPGEQARVPFTVSVPADASPGDHSGGIVTSSVTSDGSTVAIDRRLGSRIQVRVSGDLVPAAAVTDVRATYHPSWNPFAAGTVTLEYVLADTGNTRVTATESAHVAGLGGVGAASSGALQVPELLAGSTLTRQLTVAGVWPGFRLGVDLRVDAEGTGLGAGTAAPATAHASVWAVPWAQLVLLALVVAAAALGPRAVEARRRRRPGAGPGPGPDHAGAAARGEEAEVAVPAAAVTASHDDLAAQRAAPPDSSRA